MQGLSVQSRTGSDVAAFTVQTTSGAVPIAGTDLRHLIGSGKMRSLLVQTCQVQGREVVLRGWLGHGVGLSQVSAYAMGKTGFTTTAILAHFYQPTSLRRAW